MENKCIVNISLTGNRINDLEYADSMIRERIGDPKWRRPRGVVWNDPGDGHTLQLIPVDLHGSIPHGGTTKKPNVDSREVEIEWVTALPEPFWGVFPPPTSDLIEQIKGFIESSFPKTWLDLMMRFNGGVPKNPVFRVAGENRLESVAVFLGFAPGQMEDVFVFLDIYENRLPAYTLPIAYDPFGNLILIGVDKPFSGEILFWDHELEPESAENDFSNVTVVASSLDDFLSNFVKKKNSAP